MAAGPAHSHPSTSPLGQVSPLGVDDKLDDELDDELDGHPSPRLCTLVRPFPRRAAHQSTARETSYRHPVCVASLQKDLQHWAGMEEFSHRWQTRG